MQSKLLKIEIVLLVALIAAGCAEYDSTSKGVIYTVNGPIQANKLGFTLTHEHVVSNFGRDSSVTSEYDVDTLFSIAVPYLRKIKATGVNSIFCCTAENFGRRVDLLKQLADSSGLNIITNTGLYGAAKDKYVPQYAYEITVEKLANRWITEFENGIDGSDIKPGFIKLAFDKGEPSEIDLKLFEAGVITHLQTGLTLVVHTSSNVEAAKAQLDLLAKYKVSPEAWIWVHAQKVEDINLLVNTAKQGAWISFDNAKDSNIVQYLNLLSRFKAEDLLNKVLLSHDGSTFPKSGETRTFEAIQKNLIPAMLENGFTNAEIEQIMIENPMEAFSIRSRVI
jgi:predicted metal-dependent phosphotriesterase family hydrolase